MVFSDTHVKLDNTKTEDLVHSRMFNIYESLFILTCTICTTFTFYFVCVVLFKLHKRRGQDVVLTAVAGLSFFIYRTSIGFNCEHFFLEGDSWHKLQQVFLLIEYCSLMIYLANVPLKYQGYLLATGISIIIFF